MNNNTSLLLTSYWKMTGADDTDRRYIENKSIKILENFYRLYGILGYTFPISRPKVNVLESTTRKEPWKFLFWKGETESQDWLVYLEFDKVLTEEELAMWRMFKLGFRIPKN